MSKEIKCTGGARIGFVNATWPFATLLVNRDGLKLNATLIGKYSFSPDQIISLDKYSIIPILGSGIRISHNIPEYPQNIMFWCFGNPQTLLDEISQTGFMPMAKPDSASMKSGMPVRWQTLVGIIIIWNALFLLDMSSSKEVPAKPGLFSFIAIFFVFLGSVSVWRSSFMQNLLMKPDRNIKEIKPFLYLIAFISGIMTVFFLYFRKL